MLRAARGARTKHDRGDEMTDRLRSDRAMFSVVYAGYGSPGVVSTVGICPAMGMSRS